VTERPVMTLLDLLGRRWALRVLWELRDHPVPTFRSLQAACGGISSSVLSARLAELTTAGIVERDDEGYRLTDAGKDLSAALLSLNLWANTFSHRLGHRET
jgi:DNA-binding HxlR family transcriptional regulator